jgi:hypothetical protein
LLILLPSLCLANAATPCTHSVYKGNRVDILEEELDFDLEETGSGKLVDVSTNTDNGTFVLVGPTHCICTFEDSDARAHVGVSVVLPS